MCVLIPGNEFLIMCFNNGSASQSMESTAILTLMNEPIVLLKVRFVVRINFISLSYFKDVHDAEHALR
jgi:hypothetical protein